MQSKEATEQMPTPMLFPIDPEVFWQRMRILVREEVQALVKKELTTSQFQTPGMTYKPLFKISEVCKMFEITRPTLYEWIKVGKLKPYKIRSRVYFLWNDIQQLITPLL